MITDNLKTLLSVQIRPIRPIRVPFFSLHELARIITNYHIQKDHVDHGDHGDQSSIKPNTSLLGGGSASSGYRTLSGLKSSATQVPGHCCQESTRSAFTGFWMI